MRWRWARHGAAVEKTVEKRARQDEKLAFGLLIGIPLVALPAAAAQIGSFPEVERSPAWRTFWIAAGVGAALAGGIAAWGSRNPASFTGPKSGSRRDHAEVGRPLIGLGVGLGLVVSNFVGGVDLLRLYGFIAGFFPIFFAAFYLIRSRLRRGNRHLE